ncbi:MAG: thiamine pyrophosphokinae [Paenibacillus sp.]|nr:thiamine pyrophosphokinae [Paenibacillus sp.]
MSERIVIATGGTLGEWALRHIEPDDTLVGADRGALFLIRNGLKPAIALGDFDSVTEEEKEEIRASSSQFSDCDPVQKDLTDTDAAFQWAMARHPSHIVLLGALGSRFDHSLANIHLLRIAEERGVRCTIVDPCNTIELLGPGRTAVVDRNGMYAHVSLLPLTMDVTGVTLEGFLYPLHDASLTIGQSLGVSNVLVQQSGSITISGGLLLLMQSKDG